MSTPATHLQAELESAILGEIEAWLPAYLAAHPGVSLTQALRDLGHVLVAVLLSAAETQANAGRAEPHSLPTLMRQVVQPILLRAMYDTAGALQGKEAS
jgi:hypothetical protein